MKILTKKAQVPWMWILIAAIIGVLLIALGLVLFGKTQVLSHGILTLYGGD